MCGYWVIRDGDSLRAVIEPCLTDTSDPEFSPSGDEFLTTDLFGIELQQYRYPPADRLGVCESPYGDDLFAADLGRSLCYLDNSRALARSSNGRIAVVDTRSMRVVDELTIEGHEPRPTEVSYPRRGDERALCTDISDIARAGDYLIVRHPLRPFGQGHAERRNGMLCFPVSSVLERHTA